MSPDLELEEGCGQEGDAGGDRVRLLIDSSDLLNEISKTRVPRSRSDFMSLSLISCRWCFVWLPPLKLDSRHNFQLAFSSDHTLPSNWIHCCFINPHVNNSQKLTGFALSSYKKPPQFHNNIVIVTKLAIKLLEMPPIVRFCF